MPAPTDQDVRLNTLALNLLRLAVRDSAAFAIANAARAGGAAAGGSGGGPAYQQVQKGIADGGVGEATAGSVPVVVVGHRGPPLPVNVVGGRAEHQDNLDVKAFLDEQRKFAAQDKPPPPPAGGGEKADSPIGKALAARFHAVLSPLTSLSVVLGQANSGAGVFQKSLSVLGASLAPILLPAFVLLSAAAVAAGDVIWSKLHPNLSGFYKLVMDVGLPAIERWAKALGDSVGAIEYWADRLKNPGKLLGDAKDNPAGVLGKAGDLGKTLLPPDPFGGLGWLYKKGREWGGKADDWLGTPDWLRPPDARKGSARGGAGHPAAGAAAGPPPATGDFTGGIGAGAGWDDSGGTKSGAPPAGDRRPGAKPPNPFGGVGEATRDVIKSLMLSMGARAEYTQDAQRAAQLAAANQDPLDAKMLMRNLQALETLLGSIDTKLTPQPEPKHGGNN